MVFKSKKFIQESLSMQNKNIKTAIIFLCLYFLFPPVAFAENGVVINELLSHPSSGNPEWVEFYNPDKIDISNYYIDDDESFTNDAGSRGKKQLVGLIASTSAYPYIELSSFLDDDKNGDYVVLFDQNGNYVDKYKYDKDPGLNVIIGRSPDGTGEFQVLAVSSQGGRNSSPQPTSTLTPTQTPIPPSPTRTPTPTKSPTPTEAPSPTPTPKTPTPTRTPTPTKTPTPAKSGPTPTPANTPSPTPKITAKPSAKITLRLIPTSILGISTNSATTKPSPSKSKQKNLVKSTTDDKSPFLIISAGIAIILIICAILVFLKIKRNNKT